MSTRESRAGWEVEIGGLRLTLADRAIVMGRDPQCDVPLQDDRVSWQHLRIEASNGAPLITDLGSSNGTYIDGARIDTEPRVITRETIIQLGSTRARVREISTEPSATQGRFRRVAIRRRTVRIGRADDNDVVLDEPNVSWHHAEVRPGNPPTLVDLGARNGVRLGNQLLQGSGPLNPGTPAGIGPFSLRIESGELIIIDERGGLSLSAQQVAVRIGELTILHPTSVSVAPGEFVALVGPSGSGKTTLLKCLAGVSQPTSGRAMIGPDPLELRLTEVGYVPQSDVVHDRLTVHEALLYAARLRLPTDTRRAEHTAAVGDVLDELRLRDHAETSVGQLSGGQRKRVACGVELIGKPTMLLLDEPTSGLDPSLERRLMLTLRRLADTGRGIVVVTHATSSLSLCDTVAVMGEGGHLLFAGSPRESLEHFQVPAYDEIYNAIELADVPAQTGETELPRQPRARARLLSGRSLASHSATLTARYARTLWRDRRTLAILLGQAPVMALLIGLLYPAHVLALPDHQPTRSAQFVFLLVTAALWLGLIDSCREIVKERSIVMRELAVGVRLDAYLVAKASLLFLLTTVQCILLVAVATLIQPLHQGTGAYLDLTGLLILTSWSTVAIGLVVSTLARSVDQSTSLIPLLLIPQLLFGAALVPLARMSSAIKPLADLMVSRWAFAGAGHTIHMNARLADAPRISTVSGYGTSFFSLNQGVAAIILVGFTAGMLLITAGLLTTRSNRAA
jgi:ABC-type multidrug transport system ATPase subunit/pSer/pThr/pTyr-binding forkhead associated (FHA) protein/ABC-type multidrug transport system permease subunit